MVFIDIPYAVENDRVERGLMEKEIGALAISDEAKRDTLAAIYNRNPRGVEIEDMAQVRLLEGTLSRLGIPFRQSEEDTTYR